MHIYIYIEHRRNINVVEYIVITIYNTLAEKFKVHKNPSINVYNRNADLLLSLLNFVY